MDTFMDDVALDGETIVGVLIFRMEQIRLPRAEGESKNGRKRKVVVVHG
jgi:hypothetical protein